MDLYHHSSPPFTQWVIENGLLQENFVVIDIGCQGGEHPRWSFLGDRLEFYGFDPIAEAIEGLRRQGRPGHTYFEIALGEEDGEREFFVSNNSFSSSFFGAGTEELNGYPEILRGRRTVAVRRLDSLFAEGSVPRADYIKLDCEGFEPYVLRGGGKYLAASGPIGITSESGFNVSPTYPYTHFQAVNEIVVEHRLLVFDVNIVRAARRPYTAALRQRPWPEPDPLSEVPHLDVGAPGTLDVVFCRDFVAEAVNPKAYCFAEVPAGAPSVDQLIKAMINFELHGLMDCALDIAAHFRERLRERFDVDKATELLLMRAPHSRNTADVVNCLSMIAKLREMRRPDFAQLLAEKDTLLTQKDGLLTEKDVLLAQKDGLLARKEILLTQKDILLVQKDALIGQQVNEITTKDSALKAVYNSRSWRMTEPLRKAVKLARLHRSDGTSR